MRSARNDNPLPSKGRDNEVRRHGRLNCRDLQCSLGEVVDISASGIRVQRKGKPHRHEGERFMITLEAERGPVEAPVHLVRVRRIGFRTYELGLEFDEMTPEQRTAITAVARAAAQRGAAISVDY
ncbi:MAG: PilZ domain-containing protein [Phycisphaerales bacterium]